jgi:hypothetical protein
MFPFQYIIENIPLQRDKAQNSMARKKAVFT